MLTGIVTLPELLTSSSYVLRTRGYVGWTNRIVALRNDPFLNDQLEAELGKLPVGVLHHLECLGDEISIGMKVDDSPLVKGLTAFLENPPEGRYWRRTLYAIGIPPNPALIENENKLDGFVLTMKGMIRGIMVRPTNLRYMIGVVAAYRGVQVPAENMEKILKDTQMFVNPEHPTVLGFAENGEMIGAIAMLGNPGGDLMTVDIRIDESSSQEVFPKKTS